ncbi:MAG: hypothetical protein ACR2J3_06640 [Aridibacter sp.]
MESIKDTTIITALFKEKSDAESAYQELLNRNYTFNDIDVIMTDETRDKHFAGDKLNRSALGNKAVEGTGVGGAVGGTIGAIIGAIAALGTTIALPGLGLVIAGPIVAALVGAGAGGAAGGLIGGLVGYGIPEKTALEYEMGLKEGGIVLGFRPKNATEAGEVVSVWEKHNGKLIRQ